MPKPTKRTPPTIGDLVAIPLPNGPCGAVWVIATEGGLSFVVVDAFWDARPEAADLAAPRLSPLPFGQIDTLHENVWKGWFSGRIPADFEVVGHVAPPPPVRRLAEPSGTMIFQNGDHFRRTLHEQWRWLHDREALQAEWSAREERYEREREEKRRAASLPKMLRERPFASWAERWPAAAVREARRIFREATAELIELGDGAPKRKRAAVLRRIVTEMNALYDREGCIETVEAHEIVERVEQLAALVGLDNDDERLTGHRDW
jgi:hypothetical protein